MNDFSLMYSESDLLFLIRIFMPGCDDKGRMVRVLRDDEEILEGMLNNEKIFEYLMNDTEPLIRVTPYLFFSVLLARVKSELEHTPYTVERDTGNRMIVFDGGEVTALLNKKKIQTYLADMLVSFIRINSFSIPVRIRKGVWRRLKFSDFDINSLVEYSRHLDEEQRFQTYKRIADICLFTLGIFSEYVDAPGRYTKRSRHPLGLTAQKSRKEYIEYGIHFYKAAARKEAAQIQDLDKVFMSLAESFNLAVKPLAFLANNYLAFLKNEVFFGADQGTG